ncbi:Serine/threonine-protein kinase PknD [compost metagenome]
MTHRSLLLALSLTLAACSSPPSTPATGSNPSPPPDTAGQPVATPPPGTSPVAVSDPYVWTVAGNGTPGFLDAALGHQGMLNAPTDMVVIRGDTYITDSANHRIRRLTYDGALETVVGTGERGNNGDGTNGRILKLDTPFKVTADEATGNVFFSELGGNLIRCIDISQRIITIAGGGDYLPDVGTSMRGVYVQLSEPAGLNFDSAGDLYVAERGGHRILRIAPDWMVTVVAGTGVPGFAGDDGQALEAEFRQPTDIHVDDHDNLYVADTGNHRIRRIGTDGTITTIAGTGVAGGEGDGGIATEAQLNQPTGVTMDAFGNLYIADSGNQRIRQVQTDGTIVTIAGSIFGGFGGDGKLPSQAQFNIPFGVSVAPGGVLLVADRDNQRMRQFLLP